MGWVKAGKCQAGKTVPLPYPGGLTLCRPQV